jgi:hypothetical protein
VDGREGFPSSVGRIHTAASVAWGQEPERAERQRAYRGGDGGMSGHLYEFDEIFSIKIHKMIPKKRTEAEFAQCLASFSSRTQIFERQVL